MARCARLLVLLTLLNLPILAATLNFARRAIHARSRLLQIVTCPSCRAAPWTLAPRKTLLPAAPRRSVLLRQSIEA